VPWANFVAARPVPVNVDGEPTEFTQVRYEATPGAVRLIVPPDCPMIHCQGLRTRKMSICAPIIAHITRPCTSLRSVRSIDDFVGNFIRNDFRIRIKGI